MEESDTKLQTKTSPGEVLRILILGRNQGMAEKWFAIEQIIIKLREVAVASIPVPGVLCGCGTILG